MKKTLLVLTLTSLSMVAVAHNNVFCSTSIAPNLPALGSSVHISNAKWLSNTQLPIEDATPLKKEVYVVRINNRFSNYSFGYLQAISDSSLTINSKPIRYGVSSDGDGRLISYNDIDRLTIHRKGSVGRGILFGALGGIVIGGIVGAIAYTPCKNCFLDFGVGFSITAGGITGLFPGGIIGSIIGSKKHHYTVNRNKRNFDNMQSQMMEVYGVHTSDIK